jgi:nicotinamidase-related amidase
MKAIVFIDVQKDFIDGVLRNDKAIEVTPKIVDFAKECVEKGYKLYATRDTHEKTTYCRKLFDNEPDIPKSGYLATREGIYLPVEHCIEMSDGWMIDNRLMEVLDGNCAFVQKPTFGSFDLTEIVAEDFDNKELDEIILCGLVTDICVVSNALLLRAKFPNTKITVMKNLCAGTTDENHEAALKVMQSCQIDVV